MASAVEYIDTRVGDSRGRSTASANRTFHATIDHVGDDPIVAIEAVVPIGSAHPNSTYSGLAVDHYVVREQMDVLNWLVDVYYVSPESSFAGWKFSTTASAQTHSLKNTLGRTGQPDGEIIGPRIYRLAKDGETFTHTAPSAWQASLNLMQSAATRPVGINVLKPTTTFSLARTLGYMTMGIVRNLGFFKGTVNSVYWFSYQPREVLFANATITEVEGTLPGQNTPGLVYETVLEFAFDPAAWTPQTRYDTYTDGHGYESPVKTRDGIGVVRTFDVYNERDFHEIFGVLQGGVPKVIPRRSPRP